MLKNTVRLSILAGSLLAATAAQAELLYGVSFDNQLITFDSATPETLTSGLFLQGLGGADVTGIDFRPGTGQLFVTATDSRLYTANLATGQLTAVGTVGPFLNGTVFGADFSPVTDQLRMTSNTQQNLRVNPGTAAGTMDGNVNIAGVAQPRVTALAYTNNNTGATATTLYGLETATNSLVRFTNENAGTATLVGAPGSLGFAASGLNGFDISGSTGNAYAAVQIENVVGSRLYQVNLATGTTTLLGAVDGINSVSNLRALAVAPTPVPEPATLAVLGVGIAAVIRRRRKNA